MISNRILILTVAALTIFSIACDEPEPATDDSADMPTDEAVAEVDDDDFAEDTNQAAAPRSAPTEAPGDELIGMLPDDIGVATGEKVTNFSLPNSDGETVDLSELLEENSVMLVFYRGGWCPFCNFQIRELTEVSEEFSKRGILPVAISVDKIEESAQSDAAYDIPFPVISDSDLVAHKAFQVLQEVSAEDVENLKEMGMDLEESSGRTHHTVAVPAIFIIDSEGIVRWAHANIDYKVRPSLDQLLAAIDGLELSQ